jgi:hypothetical protein
MSYPDRIGLARERMLQAEAELDRYVQGGRGNPGQFKQLSDALKASRDEYIDQLECLCPPFHE